jgi:non-specific protein-tyrosine kinase
MAEKSTALERMRKKALETTRDAAAIEGLRLRKTEPTSETEDSPSTKADMAVQADEEASGRKLTAFGRMRRTAVGLISTRGGKTQPENDVAEAVDNRLPESAVTAAEAQPQAGTIAGQPPEPACQAEKVSENTGIDELCAAPANDYSPVCREKIGWVSPTYTVSRPVRIDPQVMARNKCVAFLSDSDEVESYRVLRTQILQRTRERGGNAVMITSALPGEGKTLTAINLALTFAKEFRQTVLLVDCDLRRQRIHQLLGIESTRGLNEYLLDDCPISDLMVWPGVEKLTLISGGRTISESSELLASLRMQELVEDMKHRYPERYVIFDVPAVLSGADALAFAPLVDHIVVTVKAGETPMPEVTRALRMLPREKVLGLVLNRQRKNAA